MVLSVRASAPRYHKKSKVHLASLPSAERRPRRESSLPQLTSKEILWDLCWTWYEEWEVSGHMRVSNKKSHRRILARVGLPAARVHVDCAIEEHPFSCVRAEHVGRGLRALEMLDKDGPCAAVRFVCAPSQPARALTLGQHGQVQHGRRCSDASRASCASPGSGGAGATVHVREGRRTCTQSRAEPLPPEGALAACRCSAVRSGTRQSPCARSCCRGPAAGPRKRHRRSKRAAQSGWGRAAESGARGVRAHR